MKIHKTLIIFILLSHFRVLLKLEKFFLFFVTCIKFFDDENFSHIFHLHL